MYEEVTVAIQAVVFDVNETLFSLAPIRERFDRTGLGAENVERWFAEVLRDGFAVAAADGFVTFPALATYHLRHLAALHGFEDPERIAEEVMHGFEEVEAHHDIVEGMTALKEAGLRLATFTNGTVGVTRDFLERTGIEDLVDEVLDVTGPERWKPRPDAYRWACDTVGVRPKEAAMVAVHPWDVHGAQQAGLTGCYLDRDDDPWPDFLAPPDLTIRDLTQLAGRLVSEGP